MFGLLRDVLRQAAPLLCLAAVTGAQPRPASRTLPRPGRPQPRPKRRRLPCASLLCFCFLAGCASDAGTCALVPLAEVPLEVSNRLLTVPVGINGQWTRMLVDTGAERTTLSQAAAARLGLAHDMQFVSRSGGVGGTTTHPDVRVDGLVLGGVTFPVERLAVSRFGQGLTVDGLLGADVLLAFDLDIDVAGSRLTLYRVRRCADAGPPWQEPAMPIAGVAARKDRMLVPITLDGASGMAVLDTGAQSTAIGIDMARRVGLTEQMLATDAVMLVRGVGPNTMVARLHRFHSLLIGPVAHRDIPLPVLPTDVGIGDALVGQDVLHERRVWLSFPTLRLFVSQSARERLARD